MPATRTENLYIVPQADSLGTSLSPVPFYPSPKQPEAVPQIWSEISWFAQGTRIPHHKGMELHQPLIVRLQYSSDGVTMESDGVDEDAWGRTQEAAKYDFLTSLGDRYISLSARIDALSRRDREVFGRLRVLLFGQTK